MKNALLGVPGVVHAEASFAAGEGQVWSAPGLDPALLVAAVEAMGFDSEVVTAAAAGAALGSPSSVAASPAAADPVRAAAKAARAAAEASARQAEAKARADAEAQLARLSAGSGSGGGGGSGNGGGGKGGGAGTGVTRLQVSGISCAVCCGKIEKELRALPGVALVTVNPATHVATVGVDAGGLGRVGSLGPMAPSPQALAACVERLGYGARVMGGGGGGGAGGGGGGGGDDDDDDPAKRLNSTAELDEWRALLLAAVGYTLPLFLLQYFFTAYTDAKVFGGVSVKGLLMLCFATPMQVSKHDGHKSHHQQTTTTSNKQTNKQRNTNKVIETRRIPNT